MSLPLPLLSVAADTAVVVDAVTHYLHRFRVDIASLTFSQNKWDLQCAVILSPLAEVETTKNVILKVFQFDQI